MNRGHKRTEESERIQSPQREPQGGCSAKASTDNTDSVCDETLIDFGINKQATGNREFPFEIISQTVSDVIFDHFAGIHPRIIEEFENCLTLRFVKTLKTPGLRLKTPESAHPNIVKRAFERARRMIGTEMRQETEQRGRKRCDSILNGYSNEDVCYLFDRIREGCKSFINSLKRLICCFFCALFDTVKHDSPYTREACYYRVLKGHIKEKIPSLSTIQKGIKWFWDWKHGIQVWKDKIKEVAEYKAWEWLYRYIMGELPRLQPSLVKTSN